LATLVEAGKIKIAVNKVYTLDETAEALTQIQTHHTTGKIVIVP